MDKVPQLGIRLIFGALFLSTGASLLIYIVSGISLVAALILLLIISSIIGISIWKKKQIDDRRFLAHRFKVGLLTGLLATAAYDVSRYVLIEMTGMSFYPFDIFSVFGQALIGAGFTGIWVTAAGVGYHLANGIGFAIAYTIWMGEKGILGGIFWAFVLEVFMVSIYPGWLNINAYREFIDVSIFGHAVYGTVLGFTAKQLIVRNLWLKNGGISN